MASLNVNLSGFAQLQRRLESLSSKEATKAGQSANRSGAGALQKAIKSEAPNSPKTTEGEIRKRKRKDGSVRTEEHHKIKNHVKVKRTRSTSQTAVQNTVGVYAYTAAFVQWGSIHNAPNRFMDRAISAAEQPVMDAMAKGLDKQLLKRGA